MSVQGFTVSPNGAATTVTAVDAIGNNVHIYFDQACTKQADGAVISQPVTLYVVSPGTIGVSCVIGGHEWATSSNRPKMFRCSPSRLVNVTPQGPTLLGQVQTET